MKIHRIMRGLFVIASLATLAVLAKAQSPAGSRDSFGTVASSAPTRPDLTYTRPTEATKVRDYLIDGFGPYPIVGATLKAGIDQASDG
jgi:hypothetical protein